MTGIASCMLISLFDLQFTIFYFGQKFNLLRHESEAVLALKVINPGGKLPQGILAGGKPAIEQCKEKQVKILEKFSKQFIMKVQRIFILQL
jgi:hypothetical protein